MDVEFLPFYFWVCMWCSLFTILVAVFDLCALMRHVTMCLDWEHCKMQFLAGAMAEHSRLQAQLRFSEDIFAGLISLIFIIDGVRPLSSTLIKSLRPSSQWPVLV